MPNIRIANITTAATIHCDWGISVLDPNQAAPALKSRRGVHRIDLYDDARSANAVAGAAPGGLDTSLVDDLKAIHRRAHPGDKFLVHCKAGMSRSAAIAIGLIVIDTLDSWKGRDTANWNLAAGAIRDLFAMHPDLKPHPGVIRLFDDRYALGGKLVLLVNSLRFHDLGDSIAA